MKIKIEVKQEAVVEWLNHYKGKSSIIKDLTEIFDNLMPCMQEYSKIALFENNATLVGSLEYAKRILNNEVIVAIIPLCDLVTVEFE